MPSTRHSPIDEDSPDDYTYGKKYFSRLTCLIFRPSIVRFRLPLTPPQGTEMPPKSTLYREVGTQDSSADVQKVNRSASRWTKADLGLLGVDYRYRDFDDIHINDADMPPKLLESNDVFVTD